MTYTHALKKSGVFFAGLDIAAGHEGPFGKFLLKTSALAISDMKAVLIS